MTTPDAKKSDTKRGQVKKYSLPTLLLSSGGTLIGGGFIGACIASGPQSVFNTNVLGDLGTWVGGLATAGALAFTAQEIGATRRQRKKEDSLRAANILSEAKQVKLSSFVQEVDRPSKQESDDPEDSRKYVPTFSLTVTNTSPFNITDICVFYASEKKPLYKDKINGTGESENWGSHKFKVPLDGFRQPKVRSSVKCIKMQEKQHDHIHISHSETGDWLREMGTEHEREANSASKKIEELKRNIWEPLKEIVEVEFTMKEHRFKLHNGRVELVASPRM